MKKWLGKCMAEYRGKGGSGGSPILVKPLFYTILLLLLSSTFLIFVGDLLAAERAPAAGRPTEQEAATGKLLSNLEAALAQKFFSYRERPVIRVAVFDFTDGEGNVTRAGEVWADIISRRLYSQPQFDVVSREKINRYLSWNSFGSLGKLDAVGLRLLQRRINTMDPGNGIHALITGEVKKGGGRSLQVQAYLVNFNFRVGEVESEKNIIDVLPVFGEIPLPTEQALQEANEIVARGDKLTVNEGRLLVLANTRGNALLETDYLSQFSKDQPFPWDKVPYALMVGKEETGTVAKDIRIGLEKIPLSPLAVRGNSAKRLEYSFLHGKCATNEVYFDEMIPSMGYHLVTSFVDLKNNQTYSETAEVQVFPGTTTVVVLSFYVPAEKERLRSQQTPRINIFQFFGKDLGILPKG